jgi:hypothetical protein
MKSIEKIGVLINKAQDMQYIFNHYDKEDKGYINYKQFAKNIFNKENLKKKECAIKSNDQQIK